MNKKIVGIYSLIHFIVDLSCVICINNLVKGYFGADSLTLLYAIIIYNFCGFALQMPFGIIADMINKNAIFSAIGCCLVMISYAFFKIPYVAAIIAGIGNSMFHVGGGIDVLNISNKKASFSGIYVSTGAMGVFLGTKSYAWNFNKYYIMIILLLISFGLLIYLYNSIKGKVSNVPVKENYLNKNAWIAIICIFTTVVIRGYIGLVMSFSWKSNLILAFLSIFAVIFGKMLGGIIGDKVGYKKISISLVISAICFIFAFDYWPFGVIGILLFNMTMPITLILLSNILDNTKGYAFGILTVALFIGFVPTLINQEILFNPIGLFMVSIISAILLIIAVINYDKLEKEKENLKLKENNV